MIRCLDDKHRISALILGMTAHSYRLLVCIVFAVSTSCSPVVTTDLRPVIKSVSPSSPKDGDSIRVTFAVVNAGSHIAPNGSYRVKLIVNGKTTSMDLAGNRFPLRPGDEVTYGKADGFYHCVLKQGSPLAFELRLDCNDWDSSNNVVTGDLRSYFGK
jgi:hypothetical protein